MLASLSAPNTGFNAVAEVVFGHDNISDWARWDKIKGAGYVTKGLRDKRPIHDLGLTRHRKVEALKLNLYLAQHHGSSAADWTGDSAANLRCGLSESLVRERPFFNLRHRCAPHDDRRMATLVAFHVIDHDYRSPNRSRSSTGKYDLQKLCQDSPAIAALGNHSPSGAGANAAVPEPVTQLLIFAGGSLCFRQGRDR
jgi:hypothetical protein